MSKLLGDVDAILAEYDEMRLAAAVDRSGGVARQGVQAPDEWREWVSTLFPRHVGDSFAARHEELWDWLWAIEYESEPRCFVGNA